MLVVVKKGLEECQDGTRAGQDISAGPTEV